MDERGKALFSGSVKNTGTRTYNAVYIVVDAFEGDQLALRVSTSADLFSGRKLEAGATTSFSKEFEDGGAKPNRYEIVRLYGVE